MKLNFEIIPTSTWNYNLRTILSKKAWDVVRREAYARANGKCVICGAKAKRLEAHERWSYDEENKVQKLEDVIGICHNCHQVIHIGRTQLIGKEDEAIKHFEKVNGCDYQGYIKSLTEANEKNKRLSEIYDWSLDLSYLKKFITE